DAPKKILARPRRLQLILDRRLAAFDLRWPFEPTRFVHTPGPVLRRRPGGGEYHLFQRRHRLDPLGKPSSLVLVAEFPGHAGPRDDHPHAAMTARVHGPARGFIGLG